MSIISMSSPARLASTTSVKKVFPTTRTASASFVIARNISSPARASYVEPSYARREPSHTSSVRKPLRMIMFGKPGAGKGTLSTRLVEKYDVEPISTGDLLRAEVQARTDIGRTAESIMASGGILDDHIVLQLVSKKLGELRDKGVQNWILDGFPRTLGQGRLLDPLLRDLSSPLSLIINLDIPDEVILGRIADRWTHVKSGRVYNLSYNRPKVPGRDDITGEPLTKRPDDKPEVAKRRLEAFYKTTSPLLQYYSAQAVSPGIPTSPADAGPSAQPQLYLTSLTGKTSDEIWPQMEEVVLKYFGVRTRATVAAAGTVASRAKVASGARVEGVPVGNVKPGKGTR